MRTPFRISSFRWMTNRVIPGALYLINNHDLSELDILPPTISLWRHYQYDDSYYPANRHVYRMEPATTRLGTCHSRQGHETPEIRYPEVALFDYPALQNPG